MLIGDRRSGKFVTPGEKLGVIEEFVPGSGTYVEDGSIYSLVTGHLILDTAKREISIHSNVRPASLPKSGDTVVGQAINVQDRNLVLKISQINNRVSSSLNGVMHVSDVSRNYIKTMFDAFKSGDLIRAKVISTANREFHLTTIDDNLGVVEAFCSQCGHSLIFQKNQLRCPRCKRIERRKIASDYEMSVA
ncbi:MAG: exosome complex component [Thermoproteota archaeon]|nr:exosome complex component [Thermoproteota archaeon]